MSSTILYKFRSGTNFEALPLPGSAARLFDVKKGIVKAKKLDAGQALEFDLSVRDATTNQEYTDESMILPRGTRVVVQRLPAARGAGLLARIARAESGMSAGIPPPSRAAVPAGYYTIDSSARDEQDEFVQKGSTAEDKELAALMAVTDMASAASATSVRPAGRVAGTGPPHPSGARPPHFHHHHHHHAKPPRPNADPDLQERVPTKKRATGIPRTFLNLSAPPVTDGTVDGEGGEAVARLQPNALGFEELVTRGGGQSEITTGTKRDLDYALKLTATSIPEHLQCGICHGVVKDAMLLPWDMEGRTACESCIRDALAQSGFVCPLTGIEGVSPDDLHPNYGLRKAAELFIKGVMEKVEEIEKQKVDEEEDEEIEESAAVKATLEGESGDKGVIVSRKTIKDHKHRHNDDPFGGDDDDDFGGDVFDVAAPGDADEEKSDTAEGVEDKQGEEQVEEMPAEESAKATSPKEKEEAPSEGKADADKAAEVTDEDSKMNKTNQSDKPTRDSPTEIADAKPSDARADASADTKREVRRRGPPAGYAMGPAGGAAWGARGSGDRRSQSPAGGARSPYGGRGRGAPYHGRGGRFFDRDFGGRGGGYHEQAREDRNHQNEGDQQDDDQSRGSKRSRSESEDFDDRRYNSGGGRGGGRGWGRGGRGYDRPYGGRFDNRGPPYRGGYDGGRGGRGPYRGHGRYGRGRGYY